MPERCAGRAGVISVGRAGGAGDAPAGGGGAGARAVRREQQHHRRAGHGSGAGKALGLLEAGRAGFADDREQTARARALLDGPQRVPGASGIDEQETGRIETESGQAVAVKRAELAPGETVARPQGRAPRRRGRGQKPQQPEAEAERRRHVGIGFRHDLVQPTAWQPAIGQGGVHLGQAEAPRRGRRPVRAHLRRGF